MHEARGRRCTKHETIIKIAGNLVTRRYYHFTKGYRTRTEAANVS